MSSPSTLDLLCTAFLETDSNEDTESADALLATRGYGQSTIRFLRVLCGIGIWMRILVRKEWNLGPADVFLGYGYLLLGTGAAVAIFAGASAGAPVFLLGFVTTCLSVRAKRRARIPVERCT